jgi:hypothetical protein
VLCITLLVRLFCISYHGSTEDSRANVVPSAIYRDILNIRLTRLGSALEQGSSRCSNWVAGGASERL